MRRILFALALCVAGCVNWSRETPPDYAGVISSPLRTDADRQEDERRKPIEFLKFAQVKPGMRVLDVWAGAGYTAQLEALAVGPTGRVWAQNAKPSKKLDERLSAHPQENLVSSLQPFDEPVPEGAKGLDLVTIVLSYHDIAALPVERAHMDETLFKALKSGGHLVLIDHSARSGTGTLDSAKLHRIDEALVLQEMTSAGFKLEGQSDLWRAPGDPREQAFFDMKTPTDRFALRFVKP
jgi:predicted methyltransferase